LTSFSLAQPEWVGQARQQFKRKEGQLLKIKYQPEVISLSSVINPKAAHACLMGQCSIKKESWLECYCEPEKLFKAK